MKEGCNEEVYCVVNDGLLVACSNYFDDSMQDLSSNAEIAKVYLEQYGYEVIRFEQEKELIFSSKQLKDKDRFESSFGLCTS